MKIAITGATGQLGQLVVQQLKEKVSPENIVALARSAQKASELGVEIRVADYDQPDTLIQALTGIDTVLLISANEIGKRIQQHHAIIEAARQTGVKWIVYTSILHADTTGISLAVEHSATEAELATSGIPFTLLRNGWYTENYIGSIQGALAHGSLMGSAGDGKISSASRADYAAAAVAVLTGSGHEGKVYELAGDEAWTMTDLAAEIARQSGKSIAYVNMPEKEYAAALLGLGLPEPLAHAFAGWDTAISKDDLLEEGHQLSTLTGKPTTPLSTIVASLVQ